MARVGLATAAVLVVLWVATLLALVALRDPATFMRFAVIPAGIALMGMVFYRRCGSAHR
jgi:hypothetical protein